MLRFDTLFLVMRGQDINDQNGVKRESARAAKRGAGPRMKALLKAEQDRGSDFLRLANALSALYPKGSEEKRLLDVMLLAVPR